MDILGSIVSSFNNLPNGAAMVLGDQVYGPYGNQRVKQGTISTSKGFTGQFTDSVAGLDYYGARFYDPVVGVFVSADVIEGNGAGMDPYMYVRDNPETLVDPTGQYVTCIVVCGFTIEPKFPNIFITPKIVYPNLLIFPKIVYPTLTIFPKIVYPTLTITPKPAPEPRESVPAPKDKGGVVQKSTSDEEQYAKKKIEDAQTRRDQSHKTLTAAQERAGNKWEGKPASYSILEDANHNEVGNGWSDTLVSSDRYGNPNRPGSPGQINCSEPYCFMNADANGPLESDTTYRIYTYKNDSKQGGIPCANCGGLEGSIQRFAQLYNSTVEAWYNLPDGGVDVQIYQPLEGET